MRAVLELCALLPGLARVCHNDSIPLIVDEAHGGHFGHHTGFPKSAMQQGADISVQSTHKTLTSMGQSSMLHMQGNLVDPSRMSQAICLLQVSLSAHAAATILFKIQKMDLLSENPRAHCHTSGCESIDDR